jgi:hypothetical protein
MDGQLGGTKSTNYRDYYKDQLTGALEYQDFVAEQLYSVGLPLFNYASKKYQIERGENKLGVEIKHDKKFRTTGNFWIEISEKSRPDKKDYFTSGIHRSDNTWLYVIGDYEEIFIFAKEFLKKLHASGKYKIIENGTRTSRGFLLPRSDAEKYAAKIVSIKATPA